LKMVSHSESVIYSWLKAPIGGLDEAENRAG
jgi:hypothetical protein